MRSVDALIDRRARLGALMIAGLVILSLSLPGVTAALAQETPDLADVIIGTWEMSQWGITVTFNDDGTAVQYANGEEDMVVSYEVVRNDYLRIEEASGRVEYMKVIEFSQDSVTVEFEGGQVVTLTPEGASPELAGLTPVELILGEWRNDDDGLTVKFRADGTATQINDAGEEIDIVYEVITTPMLRVTVNGETVNYEIAELNGATLTLIYQGESSTLRRTAWPPLPVAEMLLGEWLYVAEGVTFEFQENNVLSVEAMGETVSASYRLLDDERVELNLAGDIVVADIIELTDTTLVLAAEDDPEDVITFTRVSEPPQAIPEPPPTPTPTRPAPEPIPDDLIGAWHTEDLTIIFEADGTGTQTFGSDVLAFTYEYAAGALTVFEEGGEVVEAEVVELSNNTLVLQLAGSPEEITLERGEAPEIGEDEPTRAALPPTLAALPPTMAPLPTWTSIPPTLTPLPTETPFPTPTLTPEPTMTPEPLLPDDIPAAIVGMWRNEYEGVTIEFRADGTVTAKEDGVDEVSVATWEITGDNKLQLYAGDEAETYRLMSLTDDELVMIYERYEEEIALERME